MTFSMVSVGIYVINWYFFSLTENIKNDITTFKNVIKKIIRYINNDFNLLKLKTKHVII